MRFLLNVKTSTCLHIVPKQELPLSERCDDELMILAQSGVKPAFSVLVERYAVRLVSACTRFVNDGQLGIELAQETWVCIWEQRAKYRPRGRFIVWLITAARNRCRNYLRHHHVTHIYERKAKSTKVCSSDQIDALLAEERLHSVHDELSRLSEPMREAIVLRYGEELRYEQMAEILNVREATLRSRVHKGLKLLRERLEKRL